MKHSTVVFTSLASNYLPKARVLYQSFKKFHPDIHFAMILVDQKESSDLPKALLKSSADQVIGLQELMRGSVPQLEAWAFRHNVMELCTAVKGAAFKKFFAGGAKQVVFLDPDIWVLDSLQPVFEAFKKNSILLTPHSHFPEVSAKRISYIECGFLKNGIYNLGFLGVKNDVNGRAFLDWWNERLLGWCFIDYRNGLFTDQKWMNLAPIYFKKVHVFEDPGLNTARWNMSPLLVSKNRKGRYMIGRYPIRFFHFSGVDSRDFDSMLRTFADDNPVIKELLASYRELLDREGQRRFGARQAGLEKFSNGESISYEQRSMYRSREDLQKVFPHPQAVTYDEPCFLHWYKEDLRRELSSQTNTIQNNFSRISEFLKVAK